MRNLIRLKKQKKLAVTELRCPNCGKEILDEQAVYCPYCAKPIATSIPSYAHPFPSPPAPYITPVKRSGFPIASGVLAIIAACISDIFGIFGIIGSFQSYYYYYGYHYIVDYRLLFTGIFGLLGFALGLTGGICALRRKNFAMAIVGVCFILMSSLFTVSLGSVYATSYSLVGVFFFGLPTLILAIISLIFVAISKNEFL